MAIVNRTPDSFHDRGATFALDRAVDRALAAAAAGADWVDVGGVPFSADAARVDEAAELDRVLPVVEAVRARSDVVLSVDTARAEVARRCLAAGADVVNDTSGLRDPAMAEAVAAAGATVVIAHSLAGPQGVLRRPRYRDVVAEVAAFLRRRVAEAVRRGVAPSRIVVDPGHDLNKTTAHSLELTRRLGEITALGPPTLVAVSHKDFVGETLGRAPGGRLPGSLAAAVWCIAQGARIVRAHDVAATVDAVRMTEALLGLRSPTLARHNT
ncbi:dihydropteroate synthase [Georgenia thermotolerans]|uniref:Dihydropteroate synthase n=2 Tax=Georgenia thermotolerans TaxID=527326 RepID=A0A7J5ULS9_9MICO|nr:dihydropteroate synthase [Georgenia thermotolerans]KAE8763240.1 dihydropteroate synthase [Georgenia thermotolerans]